MMKEGHTASEIGHILVEGGCGAASMKGGAALVCCIQVKVMYGWLSFLLIYSIIIQ